MEIDLGSTDDAYLYLIWALEPTGIIAASDDDGGPGVWDAKIVRNLPAGVYLIEATTYFPNRSGSFLLRFRTR